MTAQTCPYYGGKPEQVRGDKIYPHRPDLHSKTFLLCAPCQAWVGCYRDGTPLGRLANAGLHRNKMAAHAAFDPLWKSGKMTRTVR